MIGLTAKLYYEDAYIQQFQAIVVSGGRDDQGRAYVLLDRTAFYPTGGGQPHDTGRIGGLTVLDVESDEDGNVRHYVDQLPARYGESVDCTVDWTRRYDHMQQHAGQHVLSAAFERLYDAETVGFHLGKETVTVDIAMYPISKEQLAAVEEQCNHIVMEDRPIETRWVDKEELDPYPLRKPPTVDENIRLVIVNDYDWSPCGGTHPSSTAQIGPIKILGMEKNKGGARVEFVCGGRTLRNMQLKQDILTELQQKLSSSETDLAETVNRLLSKNKMLDKEVQALRFEVLSYQAKDLLHSAEEWNGYRLVAGQLPSSGLKDLQILAKHLTNHERTVAILIGIPEDTEDSKTVDAKVVELASKGLPVVIARSADIDVPMNTLFKGLQEEFGGKGGGSPSTAQGTLITDRPAEEVVRYAVNIL